MPQPEDQQPRGASLCRLEHEWIGHLGMSRRFHRYHRTDSVRIAVAFVTFPLSTVLRFMNPKWYNRAMFEIEAVS